MRKLLILLRPFVLFSFWKWQLTFKWLYCQFQFLTKYLTESWIFCVYFICSYVAFKGTYVGKPLAKKFFMCQFEDYYMGRNDCESFTGKIVSTLINYTSVVWYYLVFFFSVFVFRNETFLCLYTHWTYLQGYQITEKNWSSKIFWSQVMIPEYFLMRIPQRLLPIIFSLDKE